MLATQDLPTSRLVFVALGVGVIAALAKVIYYYWIGQPAGPSINTALGFTRATVRLLDVGHSSDTFHNKEFGFQVDKVKLIWLRVISVVLLFALPLLLIAGVFGAVKTSILLIAALSAYIGVFVERWLFFAEARHVVNLYHGLQRT